MLLLKTLRAHDALKTRGPGLSPRQRQVLILADGKRSSDDITHLMGPAVGADIEKLLGERYLVSVEEVESAESGFGPTAMGEMWDVSQYNNDLGQTSGF